MIRQMHFEKRVLGRPSELSGKIEDGYGLIFGLWPCHIVILATATTRQQQRHADKTDNDNCKHSIAKCCAQQ